MEKPTKSHENLIERLKRRLGRRATDFVDEAVSADTDIQPYGTTEVTIDPIITERDAFVPYIGEAATAKLFGDAAESEDEINARAPINVLKIVIGGGNYAWAEGELVKAVMNYLWWRRKSNICSYIFPHRRRIAC